MNAWYRELMLGFMIFELVLLCYIAYWAHH